MPSIVSKTEGLSNTTSLTIDIPKSEDVKNGRLLLAFIGTDNGLTTTPPTGWTEVLTTGSGSSSGGVWAKKITVASSEPDNYTFTASGVTRWTYCIAVVSGTKTESDIMNAKVVGSIAATNAAPSVTLTEDDSMLISFFLNVQTRAIVTPPSGMTQLFSQSNNANGSSIFGFYQTGLDAGATGTRTLVINATGGTSCQASLGLPPPVQPPPHGRRILTVSY